MVLAENSAGFILYRAGSPREYLLLDYGHHWDYPKGHIEKGETPLDAAVRELKEETGIADARVVEGFARKIGYFFRHKKRGLVRKSVIFFLAETKARKAKLSDEHVDFAFLPYEEAMKRLTYASAREVLRLAEEYSEKWSGLGTEKKS